jgi:hypothetical protein
MDLTKSAIASVTKEDWVGYSKHLQMLDEQYWEKDGQLPDVIDNIIISLGATDSNSSESSIAVVTMTQILILLTHQNWYNCFQNKTIVR